VTVYGSLGDISDSQLQAALDRCGVGRLVRAEAFTVGLFGKNVGIVTDAGRWVLRGDPWPAHVDDQFRRERFWAASVREQCPPVPTPWPFHIDTDESLFGWPYQLTPWMPGEQDRTETGAAALGRAAAALRSVTFDAFGDWSPERDDVAPFAGSAVQWLTHRTEEWIARCVDRPLVDADLAFVQSLIPAALDEVVPSYVHHDLKPGNCVCVDGVVSGLFDLGEGLVADPLENLARPMWDLARHEVPLASTFLRAYEDASGVRVPLQRLRDYVTLDLLVVWEFGSRKTQAWFDDPTFESWAAAFAEPVDRALEVFSA
jgi:aminoglycoside phosphotransferase (APT) family kinase protein